MSISTVQSNPHLAEEFLSPANLERADAAVIEIFAMMFGFDIQAMNASDCDAQSEPEMNERTAVVGFSGAMRGCCQIRVSTAAARSIASAMLGGAPIEDDDDSLNDALGELCNMLAGGWKNATPGLSSECTLSPPTVITGQDYKVHIRQPSAKLSRTYLFDTHSLQLTLHCEDVDATHP